MARWTMVVDLRKCIGCETCKRVCEKINNAPPAVEWRRIVSCEINPNPQEKRLFLPMGCMHCSKPPCLRACPTGATYSRPDGIVDINYDLCLGCGACMLACPYRARSITTEDKIPEQMGANEQEVAMFESDRIGICTKCNFCSPRVDAGLSQGLQPGTDPQATPTCVRFCIAEALHFGDLDDPDSMVSKLIRENKTVRLNEELDTDAAVYYIVDGISFLERKES